MANNSIEIKDIGAVAVFFAAFFARIGWEIGGWFWRPI
jgi:diacylglycerol kinase